MQEEGGSSREVSAGAEPQQGEGEGERHTEVRDSNTNTLVVHRVHLHSQLRAQCSHPGTVPHLLQRHEKREVEGEGGRRSRMSSSSAALPASGIHLSLPSPKQNYEEGL